MTVTQDNLTTAEQQQIADCKAAIVWANAQPAPGPSKDPNDAPLGAYRLISPTQLHRSGHFKNSTRTRVDKALELLQQVEAIEWMKTPKDRRTNALLHSALVAGPDRTIDQILEGITARLKVLFLKKKVQRAQKQANPKQPKKPAAKKAVKKAPKPKPKAKASRLKPAAKRKAKK